MARYFAYVSGENSELARAELDSLIRIRDSKASLTWTGPLVLIETHCEPSSFLVDRAAMIREAGSVIAEGNSSDDTLNWIQDDVLRTNVDSSDSFSVRSKSLTGSREIERREGLTLLLGERIRHVTRARVSLESPDVKILVVLTPSKTLVCKSRESLLRRVLRLREPGKKAFFHPSMMNSQLARAMCNIAGIQPGNSVLDPFCGAGGILCEITALDARAIGMDLNWRLLRGALTNLSEISLGDSSLIQADTNLPPIGKQKLDCIVTDPPYGRISSTRGAEANRLVRAFLERTPEMIRNGGRLCISGSSGMGLGDMVGELGFDVAYRIAVHVHSGLTRDIIAVQF